MNLFKGKIKCLKCSKNFNFKNDHGQHIYICSGYKNYGSDFCPRNMIFEKDLIDIISKHLTLNNIQWNSEEELNSYVQRIDVNKEHVIIHYKDNTKSEWNNEKVVF